MNKRDAAAILTELHKVLSPEDYFDMVHFINAFVGEDEYIDTGLETPDGDKLYARLDKEDAGD